MSNSIAPGSSADVNVKVTALTTNPNVPVTYKTIILKKNLVNGVNTLTQEMMSAQNTKYVVKYDYVLGEDITVPTNCVLEFDGGSIDGSYNLIGQNTIFTGNIKFGNSITLSGSINSEIWSLDYFPDKEDYSDLVNMLISISHKYIKQIVFNKNKEYVFSSMLLLDNNNANDTILNFNNCTIIDNTSRAFDKYHNPLFCISGVNNVVIENINYIARNKVSAAQDPTEDKKSMFFHIGQLDTVVTNTYNINIKNIKFISSNIWDIIAIGVGGNAYNINIDNIEITSDIWLGLNFEWMSDGVNITPPHDCHVSNIVGKNLYKLEKGLLRCSAAYNIIFENCVGYNVRTLIDIWNGDWGLQNNQSTIIFNNCLDIMDDNYPENTYHLGFSYNNKAGYDEGGGVLWDGTYPIQVLLNNCVFKSSYKRSCASAIGYVIRLMTSQAPIQFNNCVFENCGRIRLQAQSIGDIPYNVILFNNCTIKECAFINSAVNVTFNGCLIETYSFSFTDNSGIILCFVRHCNAIFNYCTFVDENQNSSNVIIATMGDDGYIVTVTNCIFIKGYIAYSIYNDKIYEANNIYKELTYITHPSLPKLLYDFDFVKNNHHEKVSGTFANKPSSTDIYVGYRYFCTDKQTTEGATDGIEIIHKGNDVWVDALGRVIS